MWWFHTAQFARTGYFVQLLGTSTLGLAALQALAARAPGAQNTDIGWLRAGVVGTWTVCTVAAGMIGYQRFQGTLIHLVRSPLALPRALLPVVGAASVFGLAALPLAGGASWLLRQPVALGPLVPTAAAAAAFWLACFSVSATVGMLFVLTPNAMTYEGALAVPMVLASGVFGTPEGTPSTLVTLAHVLPTRAAVELLQQVTRGSSPTAGLVVECLVVSSLWIGIAWWAANVVARRASADGTLEVV
jgi:ABC-2 type transport system permease protein